MKDWSEIGRNPVKVANILATRNYDLFKFIDGNRDIDHSKRVESSISEVGMLYCPILVNEKYEIIDGQHRFEACKNLNLPILFTVQNGIGISEVRKMNSVSKNWKSKNYIHSYAHGDESTQDYKYLEILTQKYPAFTEKTICMAIDGNAGRNHAAKIKDGTYVCTESQYESAILALDFLESFRENIDKISGRNDYYYSALLFCYSDQNIDNDYLLKKFNKYHTHLDEVATISKALEEIERKVYNYQMRAPYEPINIRFDYDRYLRAKKHRKR